MSFSKKSIKQVEMRLKKFISGLMVDYEISEEEAKELIRLALK